MPPTPEWLETDALGGFAMGTPTLERTRRYHALLISSNKPPTERFMLVADVEAWLTTSRGRFALSSHRYTGGGGGGDGVLYPDGATRIESFTHEPWPTWTFRCEDGTRLRHERLMVRGQPTVTLLWTLIDDAGNESAAAPGQPISLEVRPLLGGRDYHALHRQNPDLCLDAERLDPRTLCWHLYPGVPGIAARSSGEYRRAPLWLNNFLYLGERERGFECTEDLASPGIFTLELGRAGGRSRDATPASSSAVSAHPVTSPISAAPAIPDGSNADSSAWIVFSTRTNEAPNAVEDAPSLRQREADRRKPPLPVPRSLAAASRADARTDDPATPARAPSDLHRAAQQYLVKRDDGLTIIAGYPWFADWGRDTFISLRGLCLAAGRIREALDILLRWSREVSDGMLPNRFPDRGEEPEFNSVDAALWFVVCVHETLEAAARAGTPITDADRATLRRACESIVAGYARGTRHAIRMDRDALIACGEPGVQLTWMDARVGDRVITPRIGKPVEIQALWINALWVVGRWTNEWGGTLERASASFRNRFWNPERSCLYDVVDVDHAAGAKDPSVRPNQIFAVGGLPVTLLGKQQARSVVDIVERDLWTPLGLRSLAPGEPGFSPRYAGGPAERDAVYHQGTVWPWVMGAFVEAWVRVRDATVVAKREARARFVTPLHRHRSQFGLSHVAEVADAMPREDGVQHPGGCPFQAWSVGELVRLENVVLAEAAPSR